MLSCFHLFSISVRQALQRVVVIFFQFRKKTHMFLKTQAQYKILIAGIPAVWFNWIKDATTSSKSWLIFISLSPHHYNKTIAFDLTGINLNYRTTLYWQQHMGWNLSYSVFRYEKLKFYLRVIIKNVLAMNTTAYANPWWN